MTVVVTHYRTPSILRECLERMMRFLEPAQIVVVDSSADTSLEQVKQHFPGIKSLEVSNHSMANMVNQGLKIAQTSYILQMNADVFLAEANVLAMFEVLKHKPRTGMVGPLCLNKQGKLQRQGLLYQRYYGLLLGLRLPSLRVNWLSGCCMLLKKEVLEQVGGLNSSLRFYNEDIEWCWRLQRAGWHCHLVNSKVIHLGGSSTPKHPHFIIEGYRGAYLLSQWYKVKPYQFLHRAFVLLEAQVKSRSRDPLIREAYSQILSMFSRQEFQESPFGESLTSSNPNFLPTISQKT